MPLDSVHVPFFKLTASNPEATQTSEYHIAAPSMESAIEGFKEQFPKHSINRIEGGYIYSYFQVADAR